MKICFLAAGNSIHSQRWIEYFSDNGHEVSWISLTPPGMDICPDIKFYHVGGTLPAANLISEIFKVRSLIRQIQPDILHAHYLGTYGLLGALSGFRPYIGTAWGSDIIFAGKSPVKGPLVRFVLRSTALLTCDAEHMKNRMITMGAPAEKIAVINFGTDVKKFNPSRKGTRLREIAGAQANAPLIISLRNFEPVYDIQTLLRAMPHVLKEFPLAKFVIIGRGGEESSLKALSRELRVENNVVFPGFVPNTQLPEILASADIYVSTSLSDAGLSASTSEAMSSAVAVAVTDSGENSRWISENEQGCLFPIKNPVALAKKLVYLLKNPEVRKKIAAAARERIVENNNFYVEMGKMERLYQLAIKRKTSR